ncbi:uncharacterized protein LOC107431899 isoform X1 [Ziziphus jujuba]|uniref:Uncharacterized protein LOC107431899 isoform X1 n=1 Tax=Ziziphus jujuba TaxID=326968 RepID=A0ABM3I7C2_ZIZJJ|nr:uncharacterized protein LOC107431899 isoform X1 [Ziziphus jujuba]XP_048322080.1 uncharacterized protein LOC107431899 isoform X1 [Ziziphus jujuba]
METNGTTPNSHESQPSNGSEISSKEKRTEKDVFVNHAEIAWHEMRKEWVGDASHKPRRAPREPIMREISLIPMKLINYLVQGLKKSNCGIFIFSLTTTYEDLLLSSEPFQQPIPLAEMVDFLVDIWLEEGLYD